jgi:hypothetical protein
MRRTASRASGEITPVASGRATGILRDIRRGEEGPASMDPARRFHEPDPACGPQCKAWCIRRRRRLGRFPV